MKSNLVKTVGIIGGLGPEATAEFYQNIVFGLYDKGYDNPPILIWNVPLPRKIEQEAITQGKNLDKCLPYLIEAAQKLEQAGADFIVMPCNTLHMFIKEIQASISIPMINLIAEVTKRIHDENIQKVALIGTSTTIKNAFYQNYLKHVGIETLVPEGKEIDEVGQIIGRLVRKTHTDQDKKYFWELADSFMEEGASDIIFGCTDLQILGTQNGMRVFDSLRILADSTINFMIND